jgi:formiminotetrahydrofolate cyclodeaminase
MARVETEARTPFLELPVSTLLEELAAPRPSPGGGSGLAVAVAIAAGILTMAARVSRRGWDEAAGAAAQAETLRLRAAALVQADAESYERALAARAAVRDLPAEQRDWELGRAFAAAAEPPLEIAEVGADVAALAEETAARGVESVRGDTLAAAALAAAAARAATVLVSINLTAIPDDPRVRRAHDLARSADEAARRAFADLS